MKAQPQADVPYLKYALFGSALAFAGPPVYIHIPKLYTEQHSISLAAIGGLLLILRAIDFIQDPVLGWFIEKFKRYANFIALGLGALLCVGMVFLFMPELPTNPELWLFLSLICVFTGFSGLQILYYSTGVALGSQNSARQNDHDTTPVEQPHVGQPGVGQQAGKSHTRVASWREAGILFGICIACVAPTLYASFMDIKSAYFVYALSFVIFLVLALIVMSGVWQVRSVDSITSKGDTAFFDLLKDATLSRLLIIGFVNSLPVGLTATLFLFYVEDQLQASNTEAGLMLLLFFLCAAIAAPFWGALAKKYGIKPVLIIGMLLSIFAFSVAWLLTPSTYLYFYLVCALSGAALGADMTLLPALLSTRLERLGAGSAKVFGIWGFVNKATLAFAAAVALPMLQFYGYEPGAVNSVQALASLSFMYAALPCILKLIAVTALYMTELNIKEQSQ